MAHPKHRVNETPLYTGARAWFPYRDDLAKRMLAVSRFGDPINLAVKSRKGLLGIPRELCSHLGKDRRTPGIPAEFRSRFKPRTPEQARVVRDAAMRLAAGQSFVLEASTGFGKTAMALDLIARVGVRTLVIVPKSDLLESWTSEARKFLGLRKVGHVRQSVYDVAGHDLVIALLHSVVIPGRYPEGFERAFGFVVWDECHRLGAETFSRSAGMFSARLRLGLSATPLRQDGKEVIFNAHLGPVAVRSEMLNLTPRVVRVWSGWSVPRRRGWDPVRNEPRVTTIPHTAGKLGHVLSIMAEDDARNDRLVDLIVKLYAKKRKLVVFSDRVNQLQRLYRKAFMRGVKAEHMGYYISQTKKKDLNAVMAVPVIFATYGMMGEGTNIPWLDACLFATPRAHVKQAVGRILREYESDGVPKPQPLILDVLDGGSSVLQGYADRRRAFYREMSAEVVDAK